MGDLKVHIKTLVKLDLAALFAMHLSNRVISYVSAAKNMLNPGIGKYYKWKYGDVFYQRIGEGSPILLLHDTDPTSSGYVWTYQVDSLSREHTVYIVDLPGCGRSVKPQITYTNYFYVLFVRDFIRQVIRKKTDVIADGYSSSFVIMAAVMDSSIIGKITAVNPYSIGKLLQTETRRSKVAKHLLSYPVLGTALYNIETSHRNLDDAFTEKILYNPFRSNDRFIDAYYEGAHDREGKGKYLLASIKGHYMTVNLKTSLGKLENKISILYGSGVKHGSDIADEYRSYQPTVRVYQIPKVRYLPMLECPKDFLQVLKRSMDS